MPKLIELSNNALVMSEEKAEILGYITADGELKIRKRFRHGNDRKGIRFQTDKLVNFYNIDKSLIKRFQEDVQNVYDLFPRYNKDKKRCYITRVKIFEDINKYGKINSYNWSIPDELYHSRRLLSAWLRAYFDGEAHVELDIKHRHKRIIVQSVNEDGLKEVQDALLKFGIESKFYRYDKICRIVISKNKNLVKYEKCVNFNHEGKKALLASLTR
jgi:hypothetical protein